MFTIMMVKVKIVVHGLLWLLFFFEKSYINAFPTAEMSVHRHNPPQFLNSNLRRHSCFKLDHNSRSNRCLLASSLHVDDEKLNRLGHIRKNAQNAISNNMSSLDDEVSRWRAAAVMFISGIVVFQPVLDQQLAKLWSYLTSSPSMIATAFRHDHWEWMLAVAAFAGYIHFYWSADRAVLQAGKAGQVHPWRKYRLQDRLEAQQQIQHQRRNNNQLSVHEKKENNKHVDDNLNEQQQQQPPLVTTQSEWNRQGWSFELWVYVVPLFIWDRLCPRRAIKLFKFGPPTAMQICRDVSCALLLYDFFFFCGHVLMHKLPFLWGIHKKHHRVSEVRAGEVVRLSLAEEVLEVLMSIVALALLSAHPVSRTIYNCIITFLLTELHCGFDFPWSPQNVIPFGLATGSRRHHYHHRYGRLYYQKFFHTFDRLFGFFQPNDGSIRGDSVQPAKNLPTSWVAAKTRN